MPGHPYNAQTYASIIYKSLTADQSIIYCTSDDSNSVYRYQLKEDQWSVLPLRPYEDSGLVVIDGVLTAVGGREGFYRKNKLFTLRQSRWVEEYPTMNTARSSPAVVTTSNGQHMIIIIGGIDWVDTVELYNTGSSNWSQLTSLPQPLILPSATICDNQLYVIGRDGNRYSCSVQGLLFSEQLISSQSITVISAGSETFAQ